MPQDTLISSLLDPRFKDLDYFPEEERSEAWELLKKEVTELEVHEEEDREILIIDKRDDREEDKKPSNKRKEIQELKELFNSSKKMKLGINKDEVERWKDLEEVDIDEDILEWWKTHRAKFPKIAQLARKYLAVPASQASSERSFSTAKIIVCDSRTRLKPKHVSQLVVWHQSSQYFEDSNI